MSRADDDDLIARSKVLIVEDEYHARKTLRALLRALGCTRIHETTDDGSGLEAVRAMHPDVVLLDWDLLGVGGAEFMRRLRSDGASAHTGVPIIMLTGRRE